MKTYQLLCTFCKKHELDKTLEDIQNTYSISFGRIFVLANKEDERNLMCTYNVNLDGTDDRPYMKLKNTISIHRRKDTNTLYTINALNHIVSLLNDGKEDPNFPVDWSNYRDSLLVADDHSFRKIETKIFSIKKID